ncbi:AMP-dependent synthetase/ligase [Streptomyces echinatus]|uniref:AMP-dependent synthetase/ligase n=1 Tax=Streptomyces echinatus TaxID=67293 RepID=UPI0037A414E0
MPSVDDRPASVAHLLLDRVRSTPDAEAYRFPVPSGADTDEWRSLSWAQAGERVKALAAGLMALGVRPEQRVAIASGTRVEWVLADLGIMCAGAATTTVYPSTDVDETAYILADSGSRVLFAEDADQVAKVAERRGSLPELTAVVTFEPVPPQASADGWVMSLARLEQLGEEELRRRPDCVDKTVENIDREHLATLIYTSGTTGRPKGVRLVHDCWSFQAMSSLHLDKAGPDGQDRMGPDGLEYLWLPLAHAFGKNQISGQIAIGHTLAIDGRMDRVAANMRLLEPSLMAAVPRLFEKIYTAIAADARSRGALRHRVFRWAERVAREYTRVAQAKGAQLGAGMETGKSRVPRGLAVRHAIADRLVYRGVRAAFGGRILGCLSGGAPLAPDIGQFFSGAGVPVLEGYGLTETASGAVITLEEFRTGSVGKPMPGVEVRIADDGEVLLRGPNIMRGYHNLPEQTAAVLEPDGWFHTGDLGELTEDGYLRITGRIKELIKTSGGKYVAPLEIESRFKGACPFAANIVVIGDGRSYCTALITLDEPAVMAWAAGNPALTGLSYAEVCAGPETRRLVAGYVDQVNEGLQRWQTIKKFAVLTRDFDLAHGEVTPSLKVKRPVIQQAYAELIESLYEATREQ